MVNPLNSINKMVEEISANKSFVSPNSSRLQGHTYDILPPQSRFNEVDIQRTLTNTPTLNPNSSGNYSLELESTPLTDEVKNQQLKQEIEKDFNKILELLANPTQTSGTIAIPSSLM